MSEENNTELFSQESLAALDDNSELQEYVRVTRPSIVVLLVAMAVCCLVTAYWCFFGTVSYKVNGFGISFPHSELLTQSVPYNGQVRQVLVEHGSYVERGMPLLLVTSGAAQSVVTAERDGVVLSYKKVGDEFKAGSPVVYMLPQQAGFEGREIIAFVSFNSLRWLKTGQQVQVTPKDLQRANYGYATGRITAINPYPTSKSEAEERLRLPQFAGEIFPEGAAYEIKILLDTVDSPDGNGLELRWSREKSRHLRFPTGSFCQIQVITRTQKVYKMIIGKINNGINNISGR